MYDAFRRRDAAAVIALMSPAIEIVQSELLPWGGRHVGHAGAQEFFGTLLRHIDSEVEMRAFVEAGERVVAVGRTRGMALDTRRAFDVNAVHVWTVVDGRATRLEAFIDTPAMLAAIR
jgi:ketosteroid isomerase-like protein